ncbi:MAG: phage baseplate assembly protein V [Oscillospiraceae bacterium]|jgi:uncharacterized protein involved in type VI secretion and phage assembly|nr:phage baseplate assembly protein V [Oscillospiraceae bacterium]
MSVGETLGEIARKNTSKNELGDTRLYGIVLGSVLEIGDKENQGKLRVKIPTREKDNSYWIPVVSGVAGKSWGIFLMPEIGDEVVIAFVDGNIHNPFVIGSVYKNSSQLLGSYAGKDNYKKAFVTKGKNKVLINDAPDEQSIEVSTAKGNRFLLDDKKNQMIISDKSGGNSVVFSTENGLLTVKVGGKLTIDVNGMSLILDGDSGKVMVKCQQLDFSADQSITMKTGSFKLDGSSVNIKASGAVRVGSDGVAEIKGKILKLN